MAQSHSKRWQKALQTEREQRIRLEDTLEQLAKQHNHLERAFRGATVLPPSFSNPTLGSKGMLFFSEELLCSANQMTAKKPHDFFCLLSFKVVVQEKVMPVMRMMTMSSLMRWKTQQSSLPYLLIPNFIG